MRENKGEKYRCNFEISAGEVSKISITIFARTQMHYFYESHVLLNAIFIVTVDATIDNGTCAKKCAETCAV